MTLNDSTLEALYLAGKAIKKAQIELGNEDISPKEMASEFLQISEVIENEELIKAIENFLSNFQPNPIKF